MTRNLLFSLMLWLLEVILVASFVSDRWTRELQRAEDQMMIDITKPDDESYTYIGLPPFRDFGNGEFAVDADLYPGSTVRVFASIGGGLHVTKDVSVPDSSTRVINVVLKVE